MDHLLESGKPKCDSPRPGIRPLNTYWRSLFLALCSCIAVVPSYGADGRADAFLNLSLEELGNVQVTSVSRKEERLADAAASIQVITADAIRQAGARSVPEALRLAPNLQVAQISANQYAISARGFNSSTANKLLVMIDGRTVYTPLYSGVFWDVQDVLLQDVDRIEVISGPGGTLWGANAVNGVINIITKQANATVGDLVHASGGGSGYGLALRHGGAFSDSSAAYRVYAKLDHGRHSTRANGVAVPDAWDNRQMGFRTDWHAGQSDLTVQGDIYESATDQAIPDRQQSTGSNLLARWNNRLADGSELRVQTYWDRTTRKIPGSLGDKLDTLDIDIQHALPETGGDQLIWGGGYRVAYDRFSNTAAILFLPGERKLHWANLFAQQEWALQPGLRLTVGGKLESNSYSGTEFLPNLKLAWKPAVDKLLWAGASRAVRAPSRIDRDFYIKGFPGGAPFLLAGGPDFRSEIANTVELGWRAQSGTSLSYSVVAFHSKYTGLRSLDLLPSGVYVIGNQIRGRMDGVEASARYQATPSWSLDANAVLLHGRFNGPALAVSLPGNDPRSQWSMASRWSIRENHHVYVAVRHVGRLPSPAVPAYTAVDARYGWRVSKAVELAVTGRNLLERRHQEFSSGTGQSPLQIERTIDVSVTMSF